MATITINVRDDVASRFRKRVLATYGGKKGSLGRAVEEALEAWNERERQQAVKQAIDLLEQGFDLGGFAEKDRAKWHERG